MTIDQIAAQNARSLEHLDGLYNGDRFVQLVETLYATGPEAIRRLTLAAVSRHVIGGQSLPSTTALSRDYVKLLESLIDTSLVFSTVDIEPLIDTMGERMQRSILTQSIIRYNMIDVPTINNEAPHLVAVGSI